MRLRHAIMISLLGAQRDRFTTYREGLPLEERLAIVRGIEGVDGIEVGFPGELRDLAAGTTKIKASGFAISAINQNTKSDTKWRQGSFTSTDPDTRKMAVQEMKVCTDLAAELGCYMVHCCPLIDGHNYNFQGDYLKMWDWLVEGLSEAAHYRTDVRISLEFKPYEARNYNIVSDTGLTLFLSSLIGENVGLTWDIGHALIAKEAPAQSIAMAGKYGRLFYLHFNDNYRDWDWDMLPGAVNVWDLVECLYYLDKLNWNGWASYDILSRSGDDAAKGQVATLKIMHLAQQFLEKLGRDKMAKLIEGGHPHESIPYLWETMVR
jgi:xylose isomerase